ncbi:Do family serine endopeptidase [Oecophyllibacter saccharovorans]|nr:Do family serine endopeptidase [Oecophyllibacter saccharovorans]
MKHAFSSTRPCPLVRLRAGYSPLRPALMATVLVSTVFAGLAGWGGVGNAQAKDGSAVLPGSAQPGPVPEAMTREAGTLPGFADLTARLLPAVVNISISGVVPVGEDGAPEGSEGDKDGKGKSGEGKPDGRKPGATPRRDSPRTPPGKAPGGPSGKGQDQGPDQSTPGGPQTPPFPHGSPLDKFFHDYMKHKPGREKPTRQIQALGSGFIIDPSGVIVTNNHVIDKADVVTVTLYDGTELPARIVGRDSKVDLAVLQVTPHAPLPAVPLGHSDKARIGDWVLAIGNPFGLSGTVTAGIISSRQRHVEHGLYDDFIQTDAAINRGNSGGPLFNLRGEVIGINTLIYGGAGGDSIGIGFAIPSDDARGLIEQLRRTGHVTRGWLGVSVQDVTHGMAEDLDFKAPDGRAGQGAILASLVPQGPAAKAGLSVGDILVRVNGEAVTGKTLPRLVAEHLPGTQITAEVWHRGTMRSVPLTLARSPEETDRLPSDTHPPEHPVRNLEDLGLKVSVIGPDERTQYGLSDSQRGVLVTRVYDNTPAARRGLVEGNVITQVGLDNVNTPDDLLKALERARNLHRSEVLLLVQDGQGLRWTPIPLK